MDLDSESSVLESVEDNDGISSVRYDASYETHDSSCSCMLENNNNNELFSEMRKGNGAEDLGSMSSPSPQLDVKTRGSLSSTTKKGYGLKRWKRIKRDVNKIGGRSIDTSQVLAPEMQNLDGIVSKRMQIFDNREKTSEDSFSSTNVVICNVDVSGVSFAQGKYSEHSESRSSKSLTAASGSGLKYETLGNIGLRLDKTTMRGLDVNIFAQSAKKARRECVKIEKENSHSSMESDSRSSNFVFVQGNYNSTDNGVQQSQGRKDYNGENGGEVHDDEQEARDGRYGKVQDGDFLHVDDVADSSSEVKEGTSENQGFSTSQDSIAQSLFTLQSAQEALQQELLKFKEISKDIRSEESASELDTGCSINRDLETEVEELFKQKLEAEVEYLAISSTTQKLRVAALDRTTLYEEQKALASEQIHVLDDLVDAKNKAVMLKKKAEKLENICEGLSNTDEALKNINKHCIYFFFQVLMLLVTLVVFMSQLSPHREKVVPT